MASILSNAFGFSGSKTSQEGPIRLNPFSSDIQLMSLRCI
jgi:hypothetical protein